VDNGPRVNRSPRAAYGGGAATPGSARNHAEPQFARRKTTRAPQGARFEPEESRQPTIASQGSVRTSIATMNSTPKIAPSFQKSFDGR